MSSKLSTLLASNPITGALLALADGFYLYRAAETGTDKSAAITLDELVQALRTRSDDQTNNSGNTTVTPGVLSIIHTAVVDFTGASASRKVILAIPAGLTKGARVAIRCTMSTDADITVSFRNATAGGTELTSFVTDASGDDKVLEAEFDGTKWNFLRFDAYATA